MTDKKKECCLCKGPIKNKCTLKCSHNFCRACIKKVINHPNQVKCPYCQQDSESSDIILESGEDASILFNVKLTNILGSVYIQCDTIGLASYHFGTLSNPYISYESPESDEWELDDGSRPCQKKYFEHHHYDQESRTFTGNIDWTPTKFYGEALWKYTMIFSEDFLTIESGNVQGFKEVNGPPDGELNIFGEDLVYERVLSADFDSDDANED
uniref:RING-type domain-containing protein n=1 Tax=Clytia hemisphaerica TaxID=252671 RepID=A0A7M5UV84_9CNID